MHKVIKNRYSSFVLCLDPLYIEKDKYNYGILSGIHSPVHTSISEGYVDNKVSYSTVGLKGEKYENVHLYLRDKIAACIELKRGSFALQNILGTKTSQ